MLAMKLRRKMRRAFERVQMEMARFVPGQPERVGRKTNYNLFLRHPIQRLTSPGRFMEDENPRFERWIECLRGKGYRRALILGNAPCVAELTQPQLKKFIEAGYLTIGLNRSIYEYQTDILMWADVLAIDDILKRRAVKTNRTTILHIRHERDHRLPASQDKGFQALHQYWSRARNFRDWPKKKLFMFRNTAVGALHLCHRLGIREVVMVGFGFDDRSYFYSTEKYKDAKNYEIISQKKLDDNCGGYTTHRIIREVLEYLLTDEGLAISYNGDSQFLGKIPGLKKISLEDFNVS